MGKKIIIESGKVRAEAEMNDSATAAAVYDALPIEAEASTWGLEVYFDIGVACRQDKDARAEMEVGELGYWPVGKAFCIFFGRTPASGPDGKPRAYSPVNPVGRVIGEAKVFAAVRDGDKIVLSKAP